MGAADRAAEQANTGLHSDIFAGCGSTRKSLDKDQRGLMARRATPQAGMEDRAVHAQQKNDWQKPGLKGHIPDKDGKITIYTIYKEAPGKISRKPESRKENPARASHPGKMHTATRKDAMGRTRGPRLDKPDRVPQEAPNVALATPPKLRTTYYTQVRCGDTRSLTSHLTGQKKCDGRHVAGLTSHPGQGSKIPQCPDKIENVRRIPTRCMVYCARARCGDCKPYPRHARMLHAPSQTRCKPPTAPIAATRIRAVS